MLRLTHLRKSFGPIVAVDDLTLEIKRGEIFGLLGPNGAGKTTTVNMAVGLLSPDRGTVEIDGDGWPTRPEVRMKIGVAPQALSLYEDLAGQENVRFFGRLYGLSGRELEERVGWCLDFVGLTERRRDRVFMMPQWAFGDTLNRTRPPDLRGQKLDTERQVTMIVEEDLRSNTKGNNYVGVAHSKGGAMVIHLRCPGCSKKLKIKEEFSGRKGKCPACGRIFRVPREDVRVESSHRPRGWAAGADRDARQPRRRMWPWALAGSVAVCVAFCGVAYFGIARQRTSKVPATAERGNSAHIVEPSGTLRTAAKESDIGSRSGVSAKRLGAKQTRRPWPSTTAPPTEALPTKLMRSGRVRRAGGTGEEPAAMEEPVFPGTPVFGCRTPSWSPDGRGIYFAAENDVWMVNVADGTSRRVTDFYHEKRTHPRPGTGEGAHELYAHSACCSPDGKNIAFAATEEYGGLTGRTRYIYVMNNEGTDVHRVCKGSRPRWARGGEGIIYDDGYNSYLASEDAMGSRTFSVQWRPGYQAGHASVSRDGSQMACRGTFPGVGSVLIVGGRGGANPRLLAEGGGPGVDYCWPDWHPDGGRLVFVRSEVGSGAEIILAELATGQMWVVAQGENPRFSPDGNKIAFDANGDIWVMDAHGTDVRRVTNPTPPGVCRIWGRDPSWSPDGRSVIFRRGNQLWAANADGSSQHLMLTFPPPDRSPDFSPCWSPDGAKILFAAARKDFRGGWDGVSVLGYTANTDGTNVRRVLGLGWGDEAAYSPDGTKIAFDWNENIWVANADGTGRRRVSGGAHPAWSPDGKSLVFEKGSKERRVLCVIDTDGSGYAEITDVSLGRAHNATWSPDGKRVAFEANGRIHLVRPDGSGSCTLGCGSRPCWSPDGNKIAFDGLSEGNRGRPGICVLGVPVAQAAAGIDPLPSGFRFLIEVADSRTVPAELPARSKVSWSSDGTNIAFCTAYETSGLFHLVGCLEHVHTGKTLAAAQGLSIWVVNVSCAESYRMGHKPSDTIAAP